MKNKTKMPKRLPDIGKLLEQGKGLGEIHDLLICQFGFSPSEATQITEEALCQTQS